MISYSIVLKNITSYTIVESNIMSCNVDSKKLESGFRGPFKEQGHIDGPYWAMLAHECRMIYDGCPSFFAFLLGSEDSHIPTFWLLLCLEV